MDCTNLCVLHKFRTFFMFKEEKDMRIILDTDKKTITVPWNYSDKLDALNKTIRDAIGDDSKKKTFSGYIDECWRYAMEHSDTQLKTAQKKPCNAR